MIFGFHDGELKCCCSNTGTSTCRAYRAALFTKTTGRRGDPAGIAGTNRPAGNLPAAIPYVRRHGAVRQGVSQPRSQKDGITVQSDHWLLQRFVTIGYYALVEFSKVSPSEDTLTEKCLWWDIRKVPSLMLDHKRSSTKRCKPSGCNSTISPLAIIYCRRNSPCPSC